MSFQFIVAHNITPLLINEGNPFSILDFLLSSDVLIQ